MFKGIFGFIFSMNVLDEIESISCITLLTKRKLTAGEQ